MINPRSVILNFSLLEPYWQTTMRKCSEISKSSFLTAVRKKPRFATKKGTLKQKREANQCKVETRKITLPRFHWLEPVCFFCLNIYWAWSTDLLFPSIVQTGSGQQCCFNRYGNLVMGQPDAGFLDRVHPNAGLPVISRFFHDKVPYGDCCRNAVVRFLNSESVCRQVCTNKVSSIFQ